MGQLAIAMLAAYIKDQGINSIVGFTLSPTKVSQELIIDSYCHA